MHLSEVLREEPIVERLADADMGYHAHMAQESRTLSQLQAQMQAIQMEMGRIQGAAQTWIGYLSKKYSLGKGDGVQEDGVIVRKSSPSPEGPIKAVKQ